MKGVHICNLLLRTEGVYVVLDKGTLRRARICRNRHAGYFFIDRIRSFGLGMEVGNVVCRPVHNSRLVRHVKIEFLETMWPSFEFPAALIHGQNSR